MTIKVSLTKLQETLKDFAIIISEANERKLPLLDFSQLVGGEVLDTDINCFSVTFSNIPFVVLLEEGNSTFTFYISEPLELTDN